MNNFVSGFNDIIIIITIKNFRLHRSVFHRVNIIFFFFFFVIAAIKNEQSFICVYSFYVHSNIYFDQSRRAEDRQKVFFFHEQPN